MILCIAAVLPMMALGAWLLYSSQKAIKTTALRDQKQIAIRSASEINRFIERPKDLLRSTASILGVLHADIWKQETALIELALNEEIFSRISLLDLQGREIATSDLGSDPIDFSNDETFLNARLDKISFSKIYLSDKKIPHMHIAVPVRRYGQISGVLMAEINLRGFWNIVDEIRIGQSSQAYVVSEQGLYVAHPDKKLVMQRQFLPINSVGRRALFGEMGSVEYKDEQNKTWLKSYAPIPITGWGFVLQQPADEVYSFLHLMYAQSIALTIVTVFLTAVLCIYMAPRLVEPIELLSKKMSLVANGDLSHLIPSERKDEIGVLIESFNEMTSRLKTARESEHLTTIGKAATAITHELKNSLIMADTYISLLPDRQNDPEFMKQYALIVPSELENWKNMLNEISEFAQKKPLEVTRLELTAFLLDFTTFAKAKLSLNGIELIVELPQSIIMIQAHPQKLRQVLTNLAINAMEAMPDGGLLCLSVDVGINKINIRLRDTGQGMAPETLQKIFDPFYSSRPNKLGLGLSICREIVERHGGKMDVESAEGSGTTFSISLPMIEESRMSGVAHSPIQMIK